MTHYFFQIDRVNVDRTHDHQVTVLLPPPSMNTVYVGNEKKRIDINEWFKVIIKLEDRWITWIRERHVISGAIRCKWEKLDFTLASPRNQSWLTRSLGACVFSLAHSFFFFFKFWLETVNYLNSIKSCYMTFII